MAPSGETLIPAINLMVEKISARDKKTDALKESVNMMCDFAGVQLKYSDVGAASTPDISSLNRDQFVGVPLATAVASFMDMRGDSKKGGHGAATLNDIFDALSRGGYPFGTGNIENAKRGLRISLAKNTQKFFKISSAGEPDAFGLRTWYPAAKEPRASKPEETLLAAAPSKEADAADENETATQSDDEGAAAT